MVRTKRSSPAAANAIKLAELGFAVPQVIAHRLSRMALAGATPSPRDRREFTGMVVEKQVAFAQAWAAMFTETVRWQQTFALSLTTATSPKQHIGNARRAGTRIAAGGLAPIHRKAAANAKRLGLGKLR